MFFSLALFSRLEILAYQLQDRMPRSLQLTKINYKIAMKVI